MDVTCSSCNKKIKVPDEKIPKGQPFSFNCPACKSRITVSPPAGAEKQEERGQPDSFDPNLERPGAMVCHTDAAKYKALFESLNFQVHTPKYHIEAINNLRFNEYKLILVTKEYEDMPHDGKSLLETLRNMNMSERRKIFVCYVAPGVRSFDNMESFAIPDEFSFHFFDCHSRPISCSLRQSCEVIKYC